MRDEGFTLVELLVALAIVGAVAALLSATLWSGGTAARRGGAVADAGETVAAAQILLRERIERLVPADAAATGTPPLPATGTAFAFLAPPPDRAGTAEVAVNRLSLAPGGRLMLTAGSSALPLLDGVRSIDLGYYGAAADDPAPRWRSAWPGTGAPPRLVRLRVGLTPGDLRTWPDLIVRPAVTAGAACRVDPQRGTCA
jgi:general secretion pathway protein J